MTKAVIFDFYETLVTCNKAKLYFGEHIAKDMKIEESVFREIWDETDAARTLGKVTFEEVILDIMNKNGVYNDKLYAKIMKKRKESKFDNIRHYDKETINLFDTLRSLNIKIGIITNCYSEEVNAIKECVLTHYAEAVLLSCEAGIKKPEPEIYHRMTVALSVPANECIYVGDGGSNELYGARDVGMLPVQATWFLKYDKRRKRTMDPEFNHISHPMGLLSYLT